MKIKIFKKFNFLVALCISIILGIILFIQFPHTTEDKITSLNSKYGLIAVESLDYANPVKEELSYLFDPKILTANVFDNDITEAEVVVKFDSENDQSVFDGLFLLKLRTNASADEIATQYAAIDIVAYAEPNFDVELNDVETPKLLRPRIVPGQAKTNASSDIVVAVIDSGVDTNHEDLKSKIVNGKDLLTLEIEMTDNFGHGTHIAGIIASESSAKIMPIKFTDGKTGKISNLAKAIKFAADNDADVINLSLGLKQQSLLLKNAVNYALKKNIPVVAAAGNYNTNKKYYPAAYDGVVAVAGLGKDGGKLPQSNYGPWVDYSSLAQDIYSTIPGNKYGYKTGTSQAAAKVSAKIAEILKANKDFKIEDVFEELNKSSSSKKTMVTAKNVGLAI